ncbi:MAG: hypothetical protein NTU91_01705 [Chloroflexi bacterium]|jgi:hypothetical protein|nr:hypothetical protein [Chloroflexota bacterium]
MHAIHADDLVLVAVVRQPRDLDIARVLGWYRIPVDTAPKTLRVDWLAFYQTAGFGEDRWSVRQAAPVRGFELVRRADLLRDEPEHPHADEPYFKVQLGPMEALPHPIHSERWKRFTFVYTTGDRLLSARDVTELTIAPGAERDRLWRMLRERPM